jgi:condensin complex subunit 1
MAFEIDKIGTSKNIPNTQRRGAIMILGMLAVADKTILESHIETMLKVGFGKIGSVCICSSLYSSYLIQFYL